MYLFEFDKNALKQQNKDVETKNSYCSRALDYNFNSLSNHIMQAYRKYLERTKSRSFACLSMILYLHGKILELKVRRIQVDKL